MRDELPPTLPSPDGELIIGFCGRDLMVDAFRASTMINYKNECVDSALAAQAAELQSLREALAAWDSHGDTLAQEVLALRADAERYRWLRDVSVPPHNFYLSVPVEFDGVRFTTQDVDAAIDAARAALKEQTPAAIREAGK